MVICSLAGSRTLKCRKNVIGFTGLFIFTLVIYGSHYSEVESPGRGALDFGLHMIYSKVTEKLPLNNVVRNVKQNVVLLYIISRPTFFRCIMITVLKTLR